MKAVKDLSCKDLVNIVEQLQAWLYLDEIEIYNSDGDHEIVEEIREEWNPNKVWPLEVCEFMAGMLGDLGLAPEFLGDKPKPESSGCGSPTEQTPTSVM